MRSGHNRCKAKEAEDLSVGTVAPDVAAPVAPSDGTGETASIGRLVEAGPVPPAFYTTSSPDCTREWRRFRACECFAVDETVSVVGASRSRPSAGGRPDLDDLRTVIEREVETDEATPFAAARD